MAIIWPETLPQHVNISDYSESIVDNVLRSQMGTGEKVRLKDSRKIRMFSLSLDLTWAQKQTLTNFYFDTLRHGVRPFEWLEPGTHDQVIIFTFKAPPSFQAISKLLFKASLKLETIA